MNIFACRCGMSADKICTVALTLGKIKTATLKLH